MAGHSVSAPVTGSPLSGTGQLLETGPTCEWCQNLPWPDTWCPPQGTTNPLLEPGSTCELCQKLEIDYKT